MEEETISCALERILAMLRSMGYFSFFMLTNPFLSHD